MELRDGETVELTPQQAQELTKNRWVLRWLDKTEHHKGEPKLRDYLVIGRWEKKEA